MPHTSHTKATRILLRSNLIIRFTPNQSSTRVACYHRNSTRDKVYRSKSGPGHPRTLRFVPDRHRLTMASGPFGGVVMKPGGCRYYSWEEATARPVRQDRNTGRPHCPCVTGVRRLITSGKVVGQFAIRRTEVCHLALIKKWMSAFRFREDKLAGMAQKETDSLSPTEAGTASRF